MWTPRHTGQLLRMQWRGRIWRCRHLRRIEKDWWLVFPSPASSTIQRHHLYLPQCDSCLFPVDCQPLVAVWIKTTLYGITSYCSKCVLVELGPSSESSSHYASKGWLRLKKTCSVSWYWWTVDVKVVVITAFALANSSTKWRNGYTATGPCYKFNIVLYSNPLNDP